MKFYKGMCVGEYKGGLCTFIFGEILDEYDPATFCGTMCFGVHPTRCGHNLQTQQFGQYPFFLDLYTSYGRFHIESSLFVRTIGKTNGNCLSLILKMMYF